MDKDEGNSYQMIDEVTWETLEKELPPETYELLRETVAGMKVLASREDIWLQVRGECEIHITRLEDAAPLPTLMVKTRVLNEHPRTD